MALAFSRHAIARAKERGFDKEAIDVLLTYGSYRHNGRGTQVVAMNTAGRAAARRELGSGYGRIARRLDFVAIVADVVVTLVRRSSRLKFHGRPRKRTSRGRETRRSGAARSRRRVRQGNASDLTHTFYPG